MHQEKDLIEYGNELQRQLYQDQLHGWTHSQERVVEECPRPLDHNKPLCTSVNRQQWVLFYCIGK